MTRPERPVAAAHAALQRRLGHAFADIGLLERALTHRSFGAVHNERLEFLGDAVLNAAVSGMLYERFSGSDEGDLTRVRAHLVREDSLHRVALSLGLPEALRLSEGEARGGGALRPSILADAVEAVIGAVFIDGGFTPACEVVRLLFGDVIAPPRPSNTARTPRPSCRNGCRPAASRCPRTASSPRAGRRTRRPSMSNARWPRWGWSSRAKASRAARPSRRPRAHA